jgi:5-methylcytosine-specific restriction endonuclease McrA
MQIIQHDVPRFEPSLAIAESPAERLLERRAAPYLETFRIPRAADVAERAAEKALHAREHYAQHRLQEKARTRRYKLAHPERKQAMDAMRSARIHGQSDGSASPSAIKKLKDAAKNCAYCGARLFRKQTDHMNPLALGGEHAARNIVIVCQDCNQRKHALSYEQWIERVDPRHRSPVVNLFASRYGAQQRAA